MIIKLSKEIDKFKEFPVLIDGKKVIILPVWENTSLKYRFLNFKLPLKFYDIIESTPKNPPE